MDLRTLEKQYMRVPAMYGKKVGIWPGFTATQMQSKQIFVYSIVIFSFITQVARLVVNYSSNVLLDQLPFLCVPIGVVIKYYGFTSHYDKFENLFESMLCDWRKKMTKDEEQIMKRYAKRGVLYAIIYLTNGYFVTTLFILVPLMPFILDLILPLNETRPRVQMYEAYYFVKNQDDYYYCIMMYTIVSLLLAMFVFVAADTIFIYAVQHCCGLLALAGHRFEYGLRNLSSSNEDTKIDYNKMYKIVVHGISIHQRALEFLIEIENAYKLSIFLLVGASVPTFIATLLRAGTVTFSSYTYQFYGYIIAQLVHMFFLTAQGQFIINVHDSVYEKGYDALWYIADVRTQTLFILIMRQNLTPPLLTAGGLMQLNLNTYAEIVKASVSYFVVLKSV